MSCHDETCVTCSDEAVEVTVVRLLEHDLALVDTGPGREHSREVISVALVEAEPGDTVLVHAKEAIAIVRGAGVRGTVVRGAGVRGTEP